MTSLRNEETEVQKVQCDLSKVTQAVNERVIQKLPFIFIMRFRDVQNAVSFFFPFFFSLRRDDREVEDGFSEIGETSALLERGTLGLYMNRKAFKTLFKKSFNLLSPASIFLSYVRNRSF